MATEVFPNVAESTLSVAATNVATTFTLASGAPFNTAGQFRLRLDDSLQQGSGIATRYEICRATFNAGNVVNVFRSGADLEGTTAQAWPIGTKVVAIVTAAGLANIGLRGYRARGITPGQTIPNSANTILTLTMQYDPNGNFASSTYTVPLAGYYRLNAHLAFGTAPTAGMMKLMFVKNAVIQDDSSTSRFNAGDAPGVHFSAEYLFAVGDLITLQCAQFSGGNQGTVGGTFLEVELAGL